MISVLPMISAAQLHEVSIFYAGKCHSRDLVYIHDNEKPYCYTIMTLPCCAASSYYGQLQHQNTLTIAPAHRPTSNYSLSHYEIIHPQHQNNRFNNDTY